MTERDIVQTLGRSDTHHPAWKSFVKSMRGRIYGYEPLNSAWTFFKQGWESAEKGDPAGVFTVEEDT